MPSTVRVHTLEHKVEVVEVTDVVITNSEQAPDGQWVREIRVFGPPVATGGALTTTFTLRIVAPTREVLEVTAPPQQF